MIKHFMSSIALKRFCWVLSNHLTNPSHAFDLLRTFFAHILQNFFSAVISLRKKPFKVYWNLLESEAKAEEKLLCHRSVGGLKCTNYISFYVCHEFCFLILQLIKLLRLLSHWFFNLVPVLCAFVRAWCRQEVNLSRDMKPVKSEFRFYAFA